ncbi:hypothetical protein Tco_0439715 [Tanacetum coccineum]
MSQNLTLLLNSQVLMMFTYDVPKFISDINGVVGGIKKYVEELKVEILDELKVLPEKARYLYSCLVVQAQDVGCSSQSSKQSQARTQPAEGKKYTNQATITQLFQRRVEKDAAKTNLNKEPIITETTTIPETTTVIPLVTTTTYSLIIPTTLPFQSPFLPSSPNTTPQPKREQVKDKGKKALSHKEADKEESKKEIKNQKKIRQAVKADVAKAKIKKGKEEFIDLQAGWTTIYSQIRKILDNLYKTEEELELEFSKPLSEQDPIIKLNTLAKKKRKNADDLHDYFRSTKRYKISVQFDDHQEGTVLNEPSLGGDCWISSEPFSLLVDLNIKYPKYSLAKDNSALVLQAVRRSSSIFTSVYVVVQKLKKALARASV